MNTHIFFSRSRNIAGAEKLQLSDLELMETLGTGTFGRVRLCKITAQNKYKD
jgi:hypothetical protein